MPPRPKKREVFYRDDILNLYTFDVRSSTMVFDSKYGSYRSPRLRELRLNGFMEYFVSTNSFFFIEKQSQNLNAFNDFNIFMSHVCEADRYILPEYLCYHDITIIPVTYFVNRMDMRVSAFTPLDRANAVNIEKILKTSPARMPYTNSECKFLTQKMKLNKIYYGTQVLRDANDEACRAISFGEVRILPTSIHNPNYT